MCLTWNITKICWDQEKTINLSDFSDLREFQASNSLSLENCEYNLLDFDFEFEVPQTLVSGNYRFSLGANDGVRNVAEFEFFEVEISN